MAVVSQTRTVMMTSQLRTNNTSSYTACPQLPKLTKVQLEKSVHRLNQTKPPPKEQGPLIEKKLLPKEQLDQSVGRLYSQALDRQKQLRDEQNRKYTTEQSPKILNTVELEESLQRIFTQAIKSKENGRAQLKAKYTSEPATRKLEKESEKESVNRLYTKPIDQRKERNLKLEEKYIHNTMKRPAARSNKDWVATVERLSKPRD